MRFNDKTNNGHTFLVLVPDDFDYMKVQVRDIETYNWLNVGVISIERKWETATCDGPGLNYATIKLAVEYKDEIFDLIVYHDYFANMTDMTEVRINDLSNNEE